MTIRNYILNGAISTAKERLEKLQAINAPQVIIDGQKRAIADLENGNLKIGGDTKVLDREFENREFKTGRGGKGYILINGNVSFFPNAKYGMYIKAN